MGSFPLVGRDPYEAPFSLGLVVLVTGSFDHQVCLLLRVPLLVSPRPKGFESKMVSTSQNNTLKVSMGYAATSHHTLTP